MHYTRWRRITLGAGLATAVVLTAAACSNESLDDVEPIRGVDTVNVIDNDFEPRVIEIRAGTEVTWTWNEAGRPHDVSGDGFSSTVMETGSFIFSFEDAGTFDYRCTLHNGMNGRVIVTAVEDGDERR